MRLDADAWRQWQDAPWGRVRYALVADRLDDLLPRAGIAPVTVLDVGGGDGRDSLRLAGQGHQVTILDPSAPMLARATEAIEAAGLANRAAALEASLDDLPDVLGERVDVVLCHFVLGYRDDLGADLGRLRACVRPGGYVSVVAQNPDGAVLRTVATEGPAAARRRMSESTRHTAMFDADVRLHRIETVEEAAADAGLRVVSRSGGRVANDVMTDDDAKQDPAVFDELLVLERTLATREPFWRLGHFWHLVLQRP